MNRTIWYPLMFPNCGIPIYGKTIECEECPLSLGGNPILSKCKKKDILYEYRLVSLDKDGGGTMYSYFEFRKPNNLPSEWTSLTKDTCETLGVFLKNQCGTCSIYSKNKSNCRTTSKDCATHVFKVVDQQIELKERKEINTEYVVLDNKSCAPLHSLYDRVCDDCPLYDSDKMWCMCEIEQQKTEYMFRIEEGKLKIKETRKGDKIK